MSNQSSKVISSGKGNFKNAVPTIIGWIIVLILFSLCQLVLNYGSQALEQSLSEVTNIALKDAIKMFIAGQPLETIFASAGNDASFAITIVVCQLFLSFTGLLLSLVGLLLAIAFILIIIAKIVDNATLTESGIYGRNNDFRKFDLTFDQILSIQQVKKSVIIFYTNEKGSKKRMAIYLEEAKEFAEACNAQLAAYKK